MSDDTPVGIRCPHGNDEPSCLACKIYSELAAPAGSAYRQLQLDDVIQPGDEFLLAGCTTDWTKVVDSIGRTVREQRARDTNQAWEFRRSYPPNEAHQPARQSDTPDPLVRLRVTHLEWDGDHDALAAGFRVTLECGHTFWRPTNILCMRGIAKSLEEKGAVCKHGCKQPNTD